MLILKSFTVHRIPVTVVGMGFLAVRRWPDDPGSLQTLRRTQDSGRGGRLTIPGGAVVAG